MKVLSFLAGVGLTLGVVSSVTLALLHHQDTSEVKKVDTGASVKVIHSPVVAPSPVVVAPKKAVSAANLALCTELDNAYKANGVSAVANLLDAVDDFKFLAYRNAANEACDWHKDQVGASYQRYLQTLEAKKQEEIKHRGSGRNEPQTGSAVLAQNGIDPYEWQKQETAKRNQEAINLEVATHKQMREECPTCRQGIDENGLTEGQREAWGEPTR